VSEDQAAALASVRDVPTRIVGSEGKSEKDRAAA
jgi:hypothetical protein